MVGDLIIQGITIHSSSLRYIQLWNLHTPYYVKIGVRDSSKDV